MQKSRSKVRRFERDGQTDGRTEAIALPSVLTQSDRQTNTQTDRHNHDNICIRPGDKVINWWSWRRLKCTFLTRGNWSWAELWLYFCGTLYSYATVAVPTTTTSRAGPGLSAHNSNNRVVVQIPVLRGNPAVCGVIEWWLINGCGWWRGCSLFVCGPCEWRSGVVGCYGGSDARKQR